MGAYSPAPVMDENMIKRTIDEIIMPTVKGMNAEGAPFKGVFFAGLMITDKGPELIEYNVRFGDPECQTLMMRLDSDIVPALMACADGTLEQMNVIWKEKTAMNVVMAAKGYPGAYEKNTEIKNLKEAESSDKVVIFHAGTKKEADRILATGGRVLNITALDDSVAEAKKTAYEALDKVDWPNGFCRRDIGWRALDREQK
jgi:phosphoribosylamine--glycine ligase